MSTGARFTVLWEKPRDEAAFERHYREVHIPLAIKLPGLRRYSVSRNVQGVRGGEPCYIVGELDFDDMASLRRAFESPEGQETARDVAVLAQMADVRSMIYELEDVAAA